MAIYNVSGNDLSAGYNSVGSSLSFAYDVTGNQVYSIGPAPPVDPMDWSGMTEYSRQNVSSIVEYAQNYVDTHNGAYTFPVITDTHDHFYNEPNYILYHYSDTFNKFMFLGDIATAYSQGQMDAAKEYIEQAETCDKFALVGNHELGDWESGQPLPITWYRPLLPESCVIMEYADALVYYYDDADNNVRFICLDSCTPIYKSAGTQLYTKNELEFLASALDSAGNRDIIVFNHAPGQAYYDVADEEKTTTYSTTTITNRGTFDKIVTAFINRTSYTFSDDSGVSHTHDYSGKRGAFIGLITGHTHHAGFQNGNGYNVYICPSAYYKSDAGISVFIIDRNLSKVIRLIAYKNQTPYGVYEYSY